MTEDRCAEMRPPRPSAIRRIPRRAWRGPWPSRLEKIPLAGGRPIEAICVRVCLTTPRLRPHAVSTRNFLPDGIDAVFDLQVRRLFFELGHVGLSPLIIRG